MRRALSLIPRLLPRLLPWFLAATSAALLAACPAGGGDCNTDGQCSGGEVCGRDLSCTSAGSVREVRTTWTVRGAPASTASCELHPQLYINYLGPGFGDVIGYAPVPCHLGQFTIDKLPTRFDQVELGPAAGPARFGTIGPTNVVTIDLP